VRIGKPSGAMRRSSYLWRADFLDPRLEWLGTFIKQYVMLVTCGEVGRARIDWRNAPQYLSILSALCGNGIVSSH
jgi:hypothetical protein